MAFSDLEKRKHKNFLEKLYAGALTNVEQKAYGASLSHFLIDVFLGVSVSLLKVPGKVKTSGRQMLSRGHMYCKYHDLFGLSIRAFAFS